MILAQSARGKEISEVINVSNATFHARAIFSVYYLWLEKLFGAFYQ
jgi:hypothetical protein